MADSSRIEEAARLREYATDRQAEIIDAYLEHGSYLAAANALGCDQSYIGVVLKALRKKEREDIADKEIVALNVKLAKQKQGQQDLNRIERKGFREHARIENAVEGYAERLVNLLGEHGLTAPIARSTPSESPAMGILHLTDIHFNETVDLAQNKYDFVIAGKRLRKLVDEAHLLWTAKGITSALVAITGDLMNSDRRLDELLANQDNRARATLGAVDILRQLIAHLVDLGYRVTCADINGNEGRVGKDIGWVNKVASDNYDETICRMLEYIFRDSEAVTWAGRHSATECVVEVAGHNWLLIHGHQIRDPEKTVAQLVSKYAKRGVIIRYVIFGHIHSGYANENFTRSPSPVGDNAYSDSALNLTGRAGGAFYTAYPDGSINPSLVDLQMVDGVEGYEPIEAYRAACPKSAIKAQGQGVVIHQVVI